MSTAWLFAAGWTLLNGVKDTLPVLTAAALHECGHLAACRLCGIRVRSFRPVASGAVIGYDAATLSYPREILAALAGPLFNLIAFLFTLLCRGRFAALFGLSSLSLALFNLLPHKRLDGGVILYALLSMLFTSECAARVLHILSQGVSILLWMCAVALQLRCGGNLSLLFVSVYMIMTL